MPGGGQGPVRVDYPNEQTAKDEALLDQYRMYLGANNAELNPEDIEKTINELRSTQFAARQQPQERTLTVTEGKWPPVAPAHVPVTVQGDPGRGRFGAPMQPLPPRDAKVTVEGDLTRPKLGFQNPPDENERITPEYLQDIVNNMYKRGK